MTKGCFLLNGNTKVSYMYCFLTKCKSDYIIYLSILIPMLMHETSRIRWGISRIRKGPDRAYPLHFTLLQLLLPLLCVSEKG